MPSEPAENLTGVGGSRFAVSFNLTIEGSE